MRVCELLEKEIEFGKAQLILVGGRPAMGKTSFARSTSVVMAEKGYKIGYFSLELNRNEWFGRASNIRSTEEIENLRCIVGKIGRFEKESRRMNFKPMGKTLAER